MWEWVLCEFIPREQRWEELEGTYKTKADAQEAAIEHAAAREHDVVAIHWTAVPDYTGQERVNKI